MKKLLNKNNKGFSLTEVLVAVLVLTMAVVSASNFLVSMMRSNSMNTSVLQAYYYSVEGLEAFRNMRDTYFMNYLNFCGAGDVNGDIFGSKKGFCSEGKYVVNFGDGAGNNGWKLAEANDGNEDAGLITESGIDLFTIPDSSEEKISDSKTFKRICEVQKVGNEQETSNEDTDVDELQVTCTTTYTDGSKIGDIALSMILTNWKQ